MQEAPVLYNRLKIHQILQDMRITGHQEVFSKKDLGEQSVVQAHIAPILFSIFF